jgi:hypothetical protein
MGRRGLADMGDISTSCPLHPYISGASGQYGADFRSSSSSVTDVENAKQLALMAVDMLWDGAKNAKGIIAEFKPRLTKEAYLSFQRGINKTELYDGAK